MRNYKIYGLREPDSDLFRYVGYTKRELNVRLCQHISDGKLNKYSYKVNWIKLLLKDNIRPISELIEDNLTLEEALEKEIFYIKFFKSMGAILTNSTKGGDSYFEMTQKIKDKISLKLKGKKSPLFIDLTGKKFGKLIVIKRAKNQGTQTVWNCECDCGNKNFETLRASLVSGVTKSCGCSYGGLNSVLSKPILQIDKKNGNILSAFESIRQATKLTEMSQSAIYDYVQERDSYGGGYDWKVINKEEYYLYKEYHNIRDFKYIYGKMIKEVVAVLPDNSEKKFKSLTEAESVLNVDRHTISKALKSGIKHKKSGIFFKNN